MADINKIFKDLQNYAENPPPGLYAKLRNKIKLLPKPGKRLLDTIVANTETGQRLQSSEREKALASLQSYIDKENIPPPFDFQKISEALASSSPQTTVPRIPIVKKWFFRAAAVLIGIVFMYTYSNRGPEKTVSSNSKEFPATGIPQTGEVSLVKDSIYSSKKKEAVVSPTEQKPLFSKQVKRVEEINNTMASSIDILNNDFFYTLTNFTVSEADDFLNSLQKNSKVSSNRYTYVNVSEKMEIFLKQLYAVNRRNKPTWKARRLRIKLNRWKKEDEQFFDSTPGKDPLDITDLSQFLKNRQ